MLATGGTKNTPAGSTFFAAYWMQSIGWAYSTTDTELPRTLISGACSDCAKFLAGAIDGPARMGQHFTGGRISILATRVKTNDGKHGSSAVVDIRVSQSRLQLVTSRGKVLEDTKPVQSATFRTWLRWLGQGWTVVDWKQAV